MNPENDHLCMLRAGEGRLWEGRWGDRDGPDRACGEDEREQHRQDWPEKEGTGNFVQPQHPELVEERLHTWILTWPQIHEQFLHPTEVNEVRTGT